MSVWLHFSLQLYWPWESFPSLRCLCFFHSHFICLSRVHKHRNKCGHMQLDVVSTPRDECFLQSLHLCLKTTAILSLYNLLRDWTELWELHHKREVRCFSLVRPRLKSIKLLNFSHYYRLHCSYLIKFYLIHYQIFIYMVPLYKRWQ